MNGTEAGSGNSFNPVKAVRMYRQLIEQFHAETDGPRRDELEMAAFRLRKCWRKWQGADTLHEMVFADPFVADVPVQTDYAPATAGIGDIWQ